jgi:hypothetical protein
MKCAVPPLRCVPKGRWHCPECNGECYICKSKDDTEGNDMLICDGHGCERMYHLKCLDPPLGTAPEGIWFCPGCASESGAPPPDQHLVQEVIGHKGKVRAPST